MNHLLYVLRAGLLAFSAVVLAAPLSAATSDGLPPDDIARRVRRPFETRPLNPHPIVHTPMNLQDKNLQTISGLGDTFSLNPQPLPPKDLNILQSRTRLGDSISLNPQPLPPKDFKIFGLRKRFGDTVSLNPQPLPPKGLNVLPWKLRLGDSISLNPQPLPPKDRGVFRQSTAE